MVEPTAGNGDTTASAERARDGGDTHLGWELYDTDADSDSDPGSGGADPGGSSQGPGNDVRALQAVEHLQAAALEMVKAARACLDVVEALVKDPGPLLDAAAVAARAAAASARVPGFPGPPGTGGTGARRTKVEHIPVEED